MKKRRKEQKWLKKINLIVSGVDVTRQKLQPSQGRQGI